MPKPSEILRQDNWFKGIGYGGGSAPVWRNNASNHCLGSAVGFRDINMGWNTDLEKVAAIIERLFPERVWRGPTDVNHPRFVAIVIGFNNHRDTTWEEIAKVLREYEIEKDL